MTNRKRVGIRVRAGKLCTCLQGHNFVTEQLTKEETEMEQNGEHAYGFMYRRVHKLVSSKLQTSITSMLQKYCPLPANQIDKTTANCCIAYSNRWKKGDWRLEKELTSYAKGVNKRTSDHALTGLIQKISSVLQISSGEKKGLKAGTTKCLQACLFCLRVRGDEVDRRFDGINLLCLVVRDLEPKFFLKGHDNLDGVQAIKPKVLLEMCIRRHLQDFMEKQ